MCLCLLQVRSDREKFTVYLDVKHFSPDDLSVKVTDDYLEIQGKHGERQVLLLSRMHLFKSSRVSPFNKDGGGSAQTRVSVILVQPTILKVA